MEIPNSDMLIPRLCEFLENNLGLYFSERRRPELENKITLLAQNSKWKTVQSYCNWLFSSELSRTNAEELARYLTIGETYFYRDQKNFDVLINYILPPLIEMRRKNGKFLRIWSAGCASGEEPYTIAIILKHIIPDIHEWNIQILGTDINPEFLEKARKRIYTKWSFRGIPEGFLESNFDSLGNNRYQLHADIARYVTFDYLNLADENYPSLINNSNAMDIVFCQNVMIYFSPNTIKRIADRFSQVLVNNGFLIVSPVEVSPLLSEFFRPCRFHHITFYQKDTTYKHEDGLKSVPVREYFPESYHTPSRPTEIKKIVCPRMEKKQSIPVKKVAPVPQIINNHEMTILYREARALFEKGSYSETEKKLIVLLNDDKDHEKAIILLAQVKANLGQLDEAKTLCERGLGLDKTNPLLHCLMATISEELGDDEKAINELKKALYLDPDFIMAHFHLGNIYLKSWKKSDSRRHFQNVLSLLNQKDRDDLVEGFDGLTAGRLKEIINSIKL